MLSWQNNFTGLSPSQTNTKLVAKASYVVLMPEQAISPNKIGTYTTKCYHHLLESLAPNGLLSGVEGE
jgi:hypothetical protein